MSMKIFLRAAALLFLTLGTMVGVQAQQSNLQILINYPEQADEGDALALSLYFNITDSTGRVNTTAQVASARMLLDDGSGYDATVEQPDSPIYIALVLDASGSMGGAAQAMREAAIQAINNAPEEAQIAVIRFNDQIDVLTEFSEDRNRAINAVGEVLPRNLAGTCLYDATFRAIELVASAPPGRRAIIVFTDGRDELADGSVCSSHVLDEVIDFANQPQSRVPIHTIGLSGGNSAINSGELRDIAGRTGGLSVIGDQQALTSSFQQIMDALRSQWLARALIYPLQGQRTAQLLVTLQDNTFPQPGIAVFFASRDYRQEPTITPTQPTPTPTIVTLLVDSIAYDSAQETISINALVENEQLVSEYRFEFKDENNLVQAEFIIPAPLPETATFPSRSLRDGEVTVALTGLDENRRVVARAEPVTFTYQGPTATPQPPTNTPAPVGATLTSIQYDEAADIITLNVNLLGAEQIARLQINVVNDDTNLLEETYTFDPQPSIQLPTSGLAPGQDYIVNVIAQGADGQILSESANNFTYTPLLTPTPTPVTVAVAITAIDINEADQEFIVQVEVQNPEAIDTYQLRLVDDETGLMRDTFDFDELATNTLRLPLAALESGQYQITLNALDATGAVLATYTIEARYSPPTPTPTATPLTGISAFVANAQSNPIIVIVIAAIAISLILLLVIVLRQPKQKTGTGFLQELTSAQPMPAQSARRDSSETPRADSDATNVMAMGSDMDKTNVIPQALMPDAVLTVTVSLDGTMNGKMIRITRLPFTIGRRERDLNFENDKNVSRQHAEIAFSGETFLITDLGSTLGTEVDGRRIAANTPTPLRSGVQIVLGKTTQITFELVEEGFDPDATTLER
jgi:hypothetical protein